MRIALYNLTTTTKIGGVESFVWDLARELVKRGHAVDILGGVGTRRETTGARVFTFPFISRRFWQALPPLRRAYAEAKLLERLTMAIAALPTLVRGNYQIIHLQKPYDLLPALLARRLSGAKVILGCHGEDFYRGDRWLARHVDAAVSCSRFNAQTIAGRYGFTPEVVFNGIDTSLFRPQPPDPTRRTRWGLPTDRPLLLFVGRLQPWKGVETAIRALSYIPHTHLIIAGDGEDRERLATIATELGLHERVTFLGSVPRQQLPDLYAAVDILVATSYASETFGIGPVEAQACGLPVVASRFGGFPEVVADGHTGLLVPPRDPPALAEAINTLLRDPDRRAAMAAAAPAWAAQFAWPAVVDRIEAVYRAVVGETVRAR
ncbi:glycosyltransferase family 4 protein [Chloroflexus aggregans]|uniref:Glycosyl transferase group 1 n=1 Tax=Chloroflexus aggregans (strain MD-66 / DSM 9485) TaxID=326427 RepID=B8G5T8_CHLAD|nr:glycosyltransferase family 4 protein [Chloroflexus aggregans]ACL23799.1 glycosyl transferase group 1 [Chloroflexus aggregans DSM 9485]